MNIHELNYVLCIAKHQNMTKAARELYISQPTLSITWGNLSGNWESSFLTGWTIAISRLTRAGVIWNMPAAFWN